MESPALPKTAAEPSRRRKRVLILSAASLTSLVLLGAVAWTSLRHRPPAPSGDPVVIAKFITTPDFDKMTLEQKAQYLSTLRSSMPALVAAARSGQFTREEQIAAVRNGVKVGARVEMHNYFSLRTPSAQQAHLDKLIDEQEMLRGYAAKARQGGPLQFSGGVELKQFVESLPPGERVQMAQFGFELFKRRMARGLTPWPYGDSAPSDLPVK